MVLSDFQSFCLTIGISIERIEVQQQLILEAPNGSPLAQSLDTIEMRTCFDSSRENALGLPIRAAPRLHSPKFTTSTSFVVEPGLKMAVQDVNALMRQLKWLVAAVIALFVVPLFICGFYLDRRLNAFEETLAHTSPDQLDGEERPRSDLYHLTANPVEGQIVYVPAYSHIYHGKGKPYLLTITLSVRNTSVNGEIVVKSVRYFDTQGNEVRSYLDKPVRLPTLGTTEIVIEREDASGGSGANFIVEWYADTPVTEPIIEAVMIDTTTQQGISFVRRGAVIGEVTSKTSGGNGESEK